MRELRTSLKEFRMEAGFTQSELAEIVGNCRDNISRLERNNCTLSELIDRINPLGVKFGIWIEPEMVNEDSDLYRNHSDWAILWQVQPPKRK